MFQHICRINYCLVQQSIECMFFAQFLYLYVEQKRNLFFFIKRKCIANSGVVMALALIFDFSVISQRANLEGFVRENERKRMSKRKAVILFYKHKKSFESLKISWSTFVTQNIKGFAIIIMLNIRYAVYIWSYSASWDEITVKRRYSLHQIFY